jgi:Kef-type K+ transport system membrane component KefB
MVVVGLKAFGVWGLLTALFVLAARRIEAAIMTFRTTGARVALGLAVCFLAAFVAEAFGLAMIIGAYSAGLGLSARPFGRRLQHELQSVSDFLVPVFFVVVGMMVDLAAIGATLAFGSVVTVLAIVTKLVGCGAPALAVGFDALGALRIGAGMLPRGEVALIIGSAGLAAQAIDPALFGVAVVMTLVTTLLAPLLLVPLFRRPAPGERPVNRGRSE